MRRIEGGDVDTARIYSLIRRESTALQWITEADWPLRLSIVLFLDRYGRSQEAEHFLMTWVSSISKLASPPGEGVPSPYWPAEKVLRSRYGLLPPAEREHFGRYVFTVHQALDMLVRRLRRQAVRWLWPDATHLIHCDFVPAPLAEYFTWNTESGVLGQTMPQRTASWSSWRERVAQFDQSQVPEVLRRHPEWTLPFVLTYPHRANRALTDFLEGYATRRVDPA